MTVLQAGSIGQGIDHDLMEWDWVLWNLLQKMAVVSPQKAAAGFGIDIETTRLIATFPRQTIERLASGVVASFRPVIDEETALALMAEPYNPLQNLENACQCSDIGATYWLIVAKAALSDPAAAAMRYGLTKPVAEATVKCTSNQLALVSKRLEARFELRFPFGLLLDLSQSSQRMVLIKKLAFCLKN
jgi:hypothetical protein